MPNQTVKLADLQAHSRNYNQHSQAQVAKIAASLTAFGQVRSIVVWRGTILAGHGVVLAARSLGWTEIRADVVDELDEARALAYVVADNELARQSDPDLAQLAAILQDSAAEDAGLLLAMGYTDAEYDALLAEVGADAAGVGDAPAQVDRAAELNEVWGVKLGDLWRIGEHRLACGDCTDAAVVARVMGGERAGACVTDPPYGINREGIANDDPEGLRALFDGCLAVMPVTDGVMVVFQSPRLEWVWLDAARASGWKPERLLWLYRTGQNAYPWRGWYMRSDAVRVYSIGHPLWPDFPEASTDCYTVNINDAESVKASSVGDTSLHSTVKPIDVIANLIDHTTGIVYEPFAGSGTTLVACQNLSRRCRAIEIAPNYVAVALQRMTDAFPALPIERIPPHA